jgi:hypothetical protein
MSLETKYLGQIPDNILDIIKASEKEADKLATSSGTEN